MQILMVEPQIDALFTRLRPVDKNGNALSDDSPVAIPNCVESIPCAGFPQAVIFGESLYGGLVKKSFLPSGTAILRTRAFAKVNGYDKELRTSQDWDLWVRMSAQKTCFAFLDQCTYLYRQLKRHYSPGLSARLSQVENRITIMRKVVKSERDARSSVATAANRRIGDFSKACGDILVQQGNFSAAREKYLCALRRHPRPIQIVNWLLSWGGRPGRKIICHLNNLRDEGVTTKC